MAQTWQRSASESELEHCIRICRAVGLHHQQVKGPSCTGASADHSSTCAAGPSVATPLTGCGMATPAPALLPALVVRSGANGAAKPQGLPDGGWKPRNSIVRDALQVLGQLVSHNAIPLRWSIDNMRYCRKGCHEEDDTCLMAACHAAGPEQLPKHGAGQSAQGAAADRRDAAARRAAVTCQALWGLA